MIKIYIQDSILFLLTEKNISRLYEKHPSFQLIKWKKESDIALMLENCENDRHVIGILGEDANELLHKLTPYFNKHVASGGIVVAPDQKILMIFRRAFWDLPKGHQEKGETLEDTALREVMEETGIKQLRLGKAIEINAIQKNKTYHTYRDKKNKLVLKECHWYEMSTDDTNALIPQTEEDIERAEWIKPSDVNGLLKLAYPSIQDVVRAFLS